MCEAGTTYLTIFRWFLLRSSLRAVTCVLIMSQTKRARSTNSYAPNDSKSPTTLDNTRDRVSTCRVSTAPSMALSQRYHHYFRLLIEAGINYDWKESFGEVEGQFGEWVSLALLSSSPYQLCFFILAVIVSFTSSIYPLSTLDLFSVGRTQE